MSFEKIILLKFNPVLDHSFQNYTIGCINDD